MVDTARVEREMREALGSRFRSLYQIKDIHPCDVTLVLHDSHSIKIENCQWTFDELSFAIYRIGTTARWEPNANGWKIFTLWPDKEQVAQWNRERLIWIETELASALQDAETMRDNIRDLKHRQERREERWDRREREERVNISGRAGDR